MWFHIPQYCNPRFNMIHVSLRCLNFLQEMEKGSSRDFQVFLVLGSGCNYPDAWGNDDSQVYFEKLGGLEFTTTKTRKWMKMEKISSNKIGNKSPKRFGPILGKDWADCLDAPCPLHLAEGSTASAPPAKKVGKVEG